MYNYADQLCARTRRRRKGCCRCSTSARENGWDVTVAVVDAGGYPILLARMDNASPASVATVVGKAQTAALIGMPTKLVEAMVSDRPALLSMDRVAVEGRSEEHTSELQSLMRISYAVFCLKKKNKQ